MRLKDSSAFKIRLSLMKSILYNDYNIYIYYIFDIYLGM